MSDEPRLIPAHAGKTGIHRCDKGVATAHPRSRGENVAGSQVGPDEHGSSPLTRGKRPRAVGFGRGGRLIPAHAGKTTRRNGSSRRAAAHPRSRGENSRQARRSCRLSGSSPLTRGKLTGPPRVSDEIRLIPAHAGKTCLRRRMIRSRPAHPRSRGENGGRSIMVCPPPGLIPAHAGKTRGNPRVQHCVAAHPRSRGENSQVTEGCLPGRGSSPLTRGKRRLRQVPAGRARLIPAHAGKTPRCRQAAAR